MQLNKSKIMKTLPFIIFFLEIFSLCALSCNAQTSGQTYSKMYNLNFEIKEDSLILYHWRENGAYANYSLSFSKGDTDRLLFTKVYFKGFPFCDRLRTEVMQRILLPYHNEKEGCIEFECKGNNLKSVSIILDGINDEEKIVYSDTLKFVPDNNKFTNVSKKIVLADFDLLNIQINAEGNISEDAYLSFSKFNVIIGDKAIDEYPVRELPALELKNETNHIPIELKTGKGLEDINTIRNSRIIGLGESVHGNDSIGRLINQIILQAVEKQKCRLVLLEMPLEMTLLLNRYIQSPGYTIDSIDVLKPETRNLLNALRIYNSGKEDKEKVNLFGIGYNYIYSTTQNSAIDIFDFVTLLNNSLKNLEVDQFAVLLMEEGWENAISFLEANRAKMQEVFTADEIDCMIHILHLSRNIGTDGIKRSVCRDSVMFVNTKFLVDKYSSSQSLKTIICGHAVHINPVSTFPVVPVKPLGSYMKKAYQEEYSPFLILVGKGTTKAFNAEYDKIDKSLGNNPKTSVEYLLSSFNEEALYLPLNTDFNRLVLSRFEGSHHILQEFYPFNLYQRYNGIFFINNGYAESDKRNEVSFEEASKRMGIKMKQRKSVLEEIKKRIVKN